jgi:predicted nucleotidyltransferase
MSQDIRLKYSSCLEKFKPIMQYCLDITIETTLKYLNGSCLSIYLVGSFGRGEGALYCNEGETRPLRDFDILVVTSKRIDHDILQAIEEEIHERLGIPSPLKGSLEEFYIWVTYTTLRDLLKCPPLLKYYELKTASKLLYGVDIRGFINIRPEDLSLYNGILILFSKVYGLLTLYPLTAKTRKRIVNYIYEVLKTYTEISTVFSLLDNSIYKPSFTERCKAFYEKYSSLMPGLFKLIPPLSEYLMMSCNRRRLLDDVLVDSLELRALTTSVVETLDKMISLYLRAGYGVSISLRGFTEADKTYIGRIGLITLAEFFSSYLRAKGVKYPFLAKLLGLTVAVVYTLFANVDFVVRSRRNRLPVRTCLLFSPRNHYVYLTYVSLRLLKLLAYGNEDELEKLGISALGEYLPQNSLVKLTGINNVALRRYVMLKIVVKLLQLADIALHRKAF